MADRLARLDDIDLGLIELLRVDGRMPNRDIAQSLGVAEGTVRSRIRRLSESQVMRVVAIADSEATGHEFWVILWLQVEGRPVQEVAEDIAAFPEALGVTIISGSYDIHVSLVARDRDDILRLVQGEIARIEGVNRIDSQVALKIVLSRPDWGSFLE